MEVYLFTVTDPQGRVVQLTEDCYHLHILVEHPDLADLNEIAQTIRKPDYIAQDAIDYLRLVYYRSYQWQSSQFPNLSRFISHRT